MENHSYVLNESGRQLTIMTKAIISRDYAFVTKPCLKCGLSPKWDILTVLWKGGVGDKLYLRRTCMYIFFN